MRGQNRQSPVGVALGNKGGKSAFTRHLQRVQPENLAGAADILADGDQCFLDRQGQAGRLGDFVEHTRQAAAREIAQAVNFNSGAQQLADQAGDRRRIALDRALEFQSFAHRHDGHAMPAQIAVYENRVAGPDAARRDGQRMFDHADAGRVDEQPVTLALVHHLGVAGNDLHAGARGGPLHRGDDPPERVHGQPFLDDETGAEIEGAGAAHREVVHRAVHGQGADIAAGKKQRPHDIGIGRERQALSGEFEDARVVLRLQQVVAERRHEHFADEPVHQRAAAAMRQQHMRIFPDRDRAGGGKIKRLHNQVKVASRRYR